MQHIYLHLVVYTIRLFTTHVFEILFKILLIISTTVANTMKSRHVHCKVEI